MKGIADYEKEMKRTVICDFVCPLEETREIFDADYTVWMDTIKEGRFGDTNKMFEKPSIVNYRVSKWYDDTDETLANAIERHIRMEHNV
jgi:adenylylsulfate kinase